MYTREGSRNNERVLWGENKMENSVRNNCIALCPAPQTVLLWGALGGRTVVGQNTWDQGAKTVDRETPALTAGRREQILSNICHNQSLESWPSPASSACVTGLHKICAHIFMEAKLSFRELTVLKRSHSVITLTVFSLPPGTFYTSVNLKNLYS